MTDCNARNAFWMTGILVLGVSTLTWADDAEKKQPDMASLIKAGQATLKRLETKPASWKAITHLAGGVQVIVDVVHSPGMRKTVVSFEAEGRREEVFRIIDRENLWYTTEGPNRGKYRPYEAPFILPTAYFFLMRSELFCVTEDQADGLGTYEEMKDGVATYRTPLDEPTRQQLRKTLDDFETLKRQRPELANDPRMSTMKLVEDLLVKGIPIKINVGSGMIVQMGTVENQTEVQDFTWLEPVNPEEFAVEDKRWEDYSDDPTEGGTGDLLMIGHSGIWSPGMKGTDTDGRLVDLKTKRMRRIPYVGISVRPGCFLPDRTRVAVSGVDGVSGGLGLYEVNLKSGENRRLGGKLLAGGITLMPALSPDGTTLAVLHKGAEEHLLETQVCLVDLKTGEARRLGKHNDLAHLSWLPDGSGLVLVTRKSVDLDKPSIGTITRMDLDGQTHKIRDGDSPVLLNDGKTILFEEPESQTWQTCDLNGGDVKVFCGGLGGHAFPSPAPDGKRIIMMHFRKGFGPQPTILQIGESEGKPAITAPGLWTYPTWR